MTTSTAMDDKCVACLQPFPERKRFWIKEDGPFCQYCAITYYARKRVEASAKSVEWSGQ
jgi:glutamine amidotransferase-like uncharacterized protein